MSVVHLNPQLIGDGLQVDPDDVLTKAVGKLRTVVVVGMDTDGSLYVAGSEGVAESVFVMEQAKSWLITHDVLRS